ncbi:MAG: PmoA family protein [Bryobacteraceae bacterium]
MRHVLVYCLAAGTCLSAQVRFSTEEIAVNVDGKPFTTFHYGTANNKPFLAPLRSASGKIVTRGFPMENIAGESRDHLHHTGVWFSYDDVNGVKFWENDPSYTKAHVGKIVVTKTAWKDGDKSGTLSATMEWRDPATGKPLLIESRDMIFYPDPKLRIIDFHVTLTAAQPVTIGDTKEGGFALRLADNFTEKKGGKIVDANGRTGMANPAGTGVWGKRSNWVDYTAEVDGERLGVAIFDNPQNTHSPAYWHARDYGLVALNPFGQQAFDENLSENTTKLATGQKLTYRWRIVIHPGDATSGGVAELYKQYLSN